MRFIFSSIFSLIGLLLAAESVFTLHQTQNAFLKDSAHCYEAYQERSQTYAGDTTFRIGIRYQNYSRSIETFINLIEKIEESFEEKNRRISAEVLAKHLLKSYHIYGLYKEKFDTFDVKRYHLIYDELSDILLDNGGSNRIDPTIREILSKEEQCIMHYMLSRFEWPLNEVQTVFDLDSRRASGDDPWNQFKRRINSKNMQFRNVDNSNPNVKYDFYEQGVVRFRNSETDAIEPARVLVGTLVGLVSTIPKLNNHELYEKLLTIENTKIDVLVGNLSSIRNEKRLDTLPALTLADLWAQNSQDVRSQGGNRKKAAATGQWNSDICPIYFQMQPSSVGNQPNGNKFEFNGYSMAQLRGGLDGLSIGWTLTQRKLSKNQLKLSTILKMYYSPRGLAVESSVCRRQETFELFLKQLKAPALQYLQLIRLYLSKGKIMDEFDLLPLINRGGKKFCKAVHISPGVGLQSSLQYFFPCLINENEMDFQSKLSDAASVNDENRAFCQEKPLLRANAIRTNPNAYGGVSDELSSNSVNGYGKRKSKFSLLNGEDSQLPGKYSETPSDLLFLVDLSNSMQQQLTIINKILSQQTLYNRETVTVLLNRPGHEEFSEGLEPIAWRSSIKDKPVCELKNLIMAAEKSPFTINRASELIDRIEFTLAKFKSEQNITMIAGKVFVVFNYGSIKHDQSQEFLAAKRNLYIKHRDVTWATIGQGDRNDLKNLINFKDTDDNVFEVNTELDLLALNVNKLIADNSAIVMYGKSHLGYSKFHETVQSNYVTPNTVQFFVISPDYFFGSKYLELKFELRNGHNIKVCYSRSDPKPSSESTVKSSDLECKSTKEVQQPLLFWSNTPCSGYTREDCPPIYLGIYGLKDSLPVSDCYEPQCANFDQIQYEFSHQGMIGSGFTKFLSWSVALFAAWLTFFNSSRSYF